MHLEHKLGETMQVEWAGQMAALVDTDTGERLDAYLGLGGRTESWTPRKRRRLNVYERTGRNCVERV